MPIRPIHGERQTRFPHNGQFGPRRYGLVQHRISPVGTAAPTHPVNPVPPPTKCLLFEGVVDGDGEGRMGLIRQVG